MFDAGSAEHAGAVAAAAGESGVAVVCAALASLSAGVESQQSYGNTRNSISNQH